MLLFEFAFPLADPVAIFFLLLAVLLLIPAVCRRLRIPAIVGFIVSGIIVGPYGTGLIARDSSIVLLGSVGLLFIMFQAALELDLHEFRRHRTKVLLFGLVTFAIPLIVGGFASFYLLHFSFLSSVLLASMFSTHTLLSYPIIQAKRLTNNRAVLLSVGSTVITDVLALITLAIVSTEASQNVGSGFWLVFLVKAVALTAIIFLGFPKVIAWFFKTVVVETAQFLFVLFIVFLGAFLAELAGFESIIGAFLAGLVLNSSVGEGTPLMKNLDFVGSSLFVPIFLISVGMLVDLGVLFRGFDVLQISALIIGTAVLTKFIAAFITQILLRYSALEGYLMFGLTTSHAAATLAIILVGYNIIIGETSAGEPIRLLNEDVLNAAILLILISSLLSSFIVEHTSSAMLKSQNGNATS